MHTLGGIDRSSHRPRARAAPMEKKGPSFPAQLTLCRICSPPASAGFDPALFAELTHGGRKLSHTVALCSQSASQRVK
jgi:hypothetical protein